MSWSSENPRNAKEPAIEGRQLQSNFVINFPIIEAKIKKKQNLFFPNVGEKAILAELSENHIFFPKYKHLYKNYN